MSTCYIQDHPDTIPTLAHWFRAQWPDYYAGRRLDDVEGDFRMWLSRDRLPVGLVAFDAAELVGAIVLRERALETRPELQPGLGGLYVAAPHRGRGIGTELVRAGMAAARALGYEVVYTSTEVAGRILGRLGWERTESVLHHGERLAVYRYVFESGATALAENCTPQEEA